MLQKIFTICCFLLFLNVLSAQEYIAGNSYWDENGYVEYLAGNLPIVVSVPHGGYLEPEEIPDRDCNGCVYVSDSYTQELAREFQEAMADETGCFPHVVINLLHRKKFDANRAIIEAADGNETVEASWAAYHKYLEDAKSQLIESYGSGIFLDLHGHAHDIQRIELGYTLSKSILQMSDESLNTNAIIMSSSIQNLALNNLQSYDHAELIRGDKSFGSLLDHRGFPSVPSADTPYPEDDEAYFSGGYNTQRHGSENGGSIDGIQIECNSFIRFNTTVRKRFADSLSCITLSYVNEHYFNEFDQGFCSLISNIESTSFQDEIRLFPNPFSNQLKLSTELENVKLHIKDILGRSRKLVYWKGDAILLSDLEAGLYLVEIFVDQKYVRSQILYKQE